MFPPSSPKQNPNGTIPKTKRIHRSNASWQKDIDLLICILRLRCEPAIPYPQIASYLIDAFTVPILRRSGHNIAAARDIPEGFDIKTATQEWMDKNLPEIFERAENGETEVWKMAREWDGGVVNEMLRISGLDVEGYKLASKGEMDIQIRWRKAGDWRSGSVPWKAEDGALAGFSSAIGSSRIRRGSSDLNRDTLRLLRPQSHPRLFRSGFGDRPRHRTVGSKGPSLFSPPLLIKRNALGSMDFASIISRFSDDPFLHQADEIHSFVEIQVTDILNRSKHHRAGKASWPMTGGWVEMTG
jgi:hypothetical protein